VTDAQPLAGRPLVSVLVRSTGRRYLSQALDSVAGQTHAPIEIVVVAAVADHPPLPAQSGPHALRLIETERPLRRSEAANRALDAARGDYLLFLDDDDWLMPGHVGTLLARLQALPEARVAYTGVALVDGQGRPLGQVFDLPFDGVRQLAGNLTPIHAVLFSAELRARGCRFDEGLDLYEDWDFWLQLAQHSVFVHSPGVSAVYRIHDSSGVHAEAAAPGPATLQLYEKWRARWTPGQLAGLMQRAWSHDDLALRLQQAEQRAQAQALSAAERLSEAISQSERQAGLLQAQQALLAEQAAALREAEARAGRATQESQLLAHQLDGQRRRTAEVEHLLARQMGRAERLAVDRQALLDSTSWRVTAPLRALGDWRVARRQAAREAVADSATGLARPRAAAGEAGTVGPHGPAANELPLDASLVRPPADEAPAAFAPLSLYLLPPHGRQRVSLVLDRLAQAEDLQDWGGAIRFVVDLANRRGAQLRLIGRRGLPDGASLDDWLLQQGLALSQDCQLVHAPWDDASAEFDRVHDEVIVTSTARNLASVLAGVEARCVMHWLSEADPGLDDALGLLQQRPEVQAVVQGHELHGRLSQRTPAALSLRLSVSLAAPAAMEAAPREMAA
jgi:hypothetical protein